MCGTLFSSREREIVVVLGAGGAANGSWAWDFDIMGRDGRKKSTIEIDSSIWREEIGNRNRLVNLAGRNRQ